MAGRVYSINLSRAKGTPKDGVESCVVIDNFGIEGDAHSGNTERQVSLLAIEDIEELRSGLEPRDINLRPGIFAENITTEGVDLGMLKIGDRISIGESVVLRITAIGKACHSGCSVMKAIGRCIMPERGIFSSVERGGVVNKLDDIILGERR